MDYFNCNICGTKGEISPATYHREVALCSCCGSNARFRGLMLALEHGLNGTEAGLYRVAEDKSVTGIGFSDSEIYAAPLRSRFDYTNTFYHTEPHVDIEKKATFEKFGALNFIVCSDVIEHTISQPMSYLGNLFDALKPGGVLVLSAPTYDMASSIERYPSLRDYAVIPFAGRHILVYESAQGKIGLDASPIFHGGPGAVLEMRTISHTQLLNELKMTGFSDVQTIHQFSATYGFDWPEVVHRDDVPFLMLGHIILARK